MQWCNARPSIQCDRGLKMWDFARICKPSACSVMHTQVRREGMDQRGKMCIATHHVYWLTWCAWWQLRGDRKRQGPLHEGTGINYRKISTWNLDNKFFCASRHLSRYVGAMIGIVRIRPRQPSFLVQWVTSRGTIDNSDLQLCVAAQKEK